jgi:hypothetical protein
MKHKFSDLNLCLRVEKMVALKQAVAGEYFDSKVGKEEDNDILPG